MSTGKISRQRGMDLLGAKKEETKIDRLAKAINRLLKGMKMYDKE